jgi:beta-mannosidase
VAATVRTRLPTFDGKTLSDTAEDRTVPPAASTRIATRREASARRRRSAGDVAVFDLMVGGKLASRNLVYFDAVRNLRLPKARIDGTVVQSGRMWFTFVSPGGFPRRPRHRP